MTQQHMIEYLQQHFPTLGATEARLMCDQSMLNFCEESELIELAYKIDSIAGQRYYPLPIATNSIKDVQINDVSIPRLVGKPLVDDDEFVGGSGISTPTSSSAERFWYVDMDRLAVVEKGSVTRQEVTSNYQTISVSGIEIRIIIISSAAVYSLSDMSDTYNEISSKYHEPILFGALARGYLNPATGAMDPQTSEIFEGKFMQGVKKAKKHRRSGLVHNGASVIRPTDF
jgi:hypothetical protein